MSESLSTSDEIFDLDEGSWAYLSLGDEARQARTDLRRDVIEVCTSNGWPAVSWSSQPHDGHGVARFIEGMDHAVERADVVIVMLDGESSVIDAELTLAFRHRRPVIGLSLTGDRPSGSVVRRMLHSYERARVVEGADIDGCMSGLREVLSDSHFTATIHEAAAEVVDRG